MLEIRENFSPVGYEDIISSAGDKAVHVTEAFDGSEKNGYIVYSYEKEKTVVYAYDDGGDIMLCDGLVRSVMFKSCMKGIENVFFELTDESSYENLRRLKFISIDSKVSENIDRFMNGCQNCKNKK
ncbi:MAG: hypothetical protein K2O29_03445 [Ruminococcus sp.]|nr:hypothetical protein [Ruminococcus sp.]